jgi:hypothetical protein
MNASTHQGVWGVLLESLRWHQAAIMDLELKLKKCALLPNTNNSGHVMQNTPQRSVYRRPDFEKYAIYGEHTLNLLSHLQVKEKRLIRKIRG